MPSIDLTPIGVPEPTTLRELRTSKMKRLGTVLSGIDKRQRQGQLFVSNLGLPQDEHDLTFHGGVDKAIHQYCSDHYEYWQSVYPEKAAEGVFRPGGFGENLVAYGFSEENVCIGDLIAIGHGNAGDEDGTCVLEVSLPRQPCFKLNQRFGIKNFAPKTHQAAKTGWYYRVKSEGHIEPGMQIRVIRRTYPKWSIARLQYYVHRDKTDMDITQELMDIDVLGKECRNVFQKRWQEFEESKKPKKVEKWRPFKVVEKTNETSRIVTLVLQAGDDDSADAPAVPWNSYANIRLPNGIKRSYSVVEGTTSRFTLGIARDDKSRGGSTYIHDHLHTGDSVHVSDFQRSMEPNFMASHAIYIVGGIGITAFLTIMKIRKITNQTFELHYAVRTEDDIAFKSLLEELGTDVVHTYAKDKGQRMDIDEIIREHVWNTQVFVCGPQRMIDAVKAAGKAAGVTDDEIFFESFVADTSGDPFSAEVVAKDRNIKVKVVSGQSLLQVMRDAGFDMPSSCETGTCGTCRIKVRKGRVEHRGTALTEEEKEGEMLCCVSRGIGDILVEDPGSGEVELQ
ncbi:hypothetical protein M409DRAFT_37396 [Zasmidium cellare ATCC 36951]|uniref:MOSC domain-containing protein n=1 Tax=Zasmidium cellare ATCC 36951 TaxID=1080233 RepID=A0A6A6C6V0_ZASCE|nr:uncharacterized protein M409DRAFT_37396 [Zasmidium cellare ATCC 36951]KAF2162765.1 hypothetical protein M409DRAFT_37396 [Zasmidium cellare ATCC 36951]